MSQGKNTQNPLVSYKNQPTSGGFWGSLNFETLISPYFIRPWIEPDEDD